MFFRRGVFVGFLLVFLVGAYVASCIHSISDSVPGVQDSGLLAPCGPHSNCISSMEDEFHPPLSFSCPALSARDNLLRAVNSLQDTANVISDQGAYIHAEVSSYYFNVWHDVEFLISQEQMHFRCTSRAGYYALPLARKRLNELRGRFEVFSNFSKKEL